MRGSLIRSVLTNKEVIMRYTKKFGLLISAVVLSLAFMASAASAQVRIGIGFGGGGYYHRPVVRRYYAPVPYSFYGGWYGPYHSDRYYYRQSLHYAKRRLNRDEDRYYSDGNLTPKESNKLDSDYYKLNRDRRRLRNDW